MQDAGKIGQDIVVLLLSSSLDRRRMARLKRPSSYFARFCAVGVHFKILVLYTSLV
jgi:hypothetical protein